jgi:hypothetical protein
MAKWQEYEKPCPRCGLDWVTDQGDAACGWAVCPYLPEELDVHCDNCRFNFYTMEGNPPCANPMTCEHSVEPLQHVQNFEHWVAIQARRGASREPATSSAPGHPDPVSRGDR